jgi:hypothetical protein
MGCLRGRELGEDDRSFGVAVEALDLAVGQFEDVVPAIVEILLTGRLLKEQ